MPRFDLIPGRTQRVRGGRLRGRGPVLVATLALLALPSSLGCRGAGGADPENVLHEYSLALEAGRAEEAYGLLSVESKKSISFEQFQRILKENPEEARELAQSLRRPQVGPPRVTATVTGPDGESSILRAYENKRYDVLLKFVPEDQLDKELTAAELKKAWEGEEKADMDRLTGALKA